MPKLGCVYERQIESNVINKLRIKRYAHLGGASDLCGFTTLIEYCAAFWSFSFPNIQLRIYTILCNIVTNVPTAKHAQSIAGRLFRNVHKITYKQCSTKKSVNVDLTTFTDFSYAPKLGTLFRLTYKISVLRLLEKGFEKRLDHSEGQQLLQMDTSDYEEIEYAVECLEKAVGLLTGMCEGRIKLDLIS